MTTPRVISRESTSTDLDTDYKWGFTIDIESDLAPKGLNEDIVRLISAKKQEPEWMLEWRLKAYRHWERLNFEAPKWANVQYDPIDYQDIYYYAAPATKDAPKSLDEVDPEVLEAFEKLGIPLQERARLAGVAVDAVLDSVSVATTYQDMLEKAGIIFCSMSDAVKNHPELVRKYLGSVVPYARQFLRHAEFGSVQRRLVRLHPQGRPLSHRVDDLFPYQSGRLRPVRTHPDRRGGGRLRQLPRGLYRPGPGRPTSCMPQWWSWWLWTTPRSSIRPFRTGSLATRTAKAASTTS